MRIDRVPLKVRQETRARSAKARRSIVSSEISLGWLDRCGTSSDPSRWFVYFLPLRDCTSFKVGFTCNPLQRIATFSSRYFERFDLYSSLLLSVPSSDEARAIEADLKKELSEARCDAPQWVPVEAGGHTEWFGAVLARQAEARLRELSPANGVDSLIEAHAFIREFLATSLQHFERWAFDQARSIAQDSDSMRLGYEMRVSPQPLRDWYEAYRYFDLDLYVDDVEVREFVSQILASRAR